jgi:hypothetical protein
MSNRVAVDNRNLDRVASVGSQFGVHFAINSAPDTNKSHCRATAEYGAKCVFHRSYLVRDGHDWRLRGCGLWINVNREAVG